MEETMHKEKKAAKQANETQAATAKHHCKKQNSSSRSWSTTIQEQP